MAEIEIDIPDARELQGLHHQAENLHVTLGSRMTVEFRADLQGAPALGPSLHLIVGADEEGPPRVTAWRAFQAGRKDAYFEAVPLEVI